jgi:hypothetical protein
MPITKCSNDYIDFIYEAIKKQYDIVISKRKIKKILRTLEIGICKEIINGNVIMFGKNATEANFVYISKGKHPRYYKKKVFFTKKKWKNCKDPVGFILAESHSHSQSDDNG